MDQIIKIFNGQIITPYRVIKEGTIVIQGDTIAEVGERNIEIAGATEIDAEGKYVSPGFIDIHVHGGGGFDFMDGEESAFLEIAKVHARYGTTSMVPTTLTSDKANILHTLKLFEQAQRKNKSGARLLGLHLEGPYFAMNQRGAQDPRYIRNPDPDEYREILSASNHIVRWSAAPEKQGALEFGRYLRKNGVLPAIAHTEAVYEDMVKALENGYTLATHLYSGMLGVTRRKAFRYAGAVESALLLNEMFVEVIADGIHLPPPLLKLVYKVKGAEKIALITDAMRAAATTTTESMLGNKHCGIHVIIEDGVAKLPDRMSFAGSIATADKLVRTMINKADIALPEAVRMISSTPAAMMKVADKKGALVPGMDADLVIFNKHINIEMTIIKGKIVYKSKSIWKSIS